LSAAPQGPPEARPREPGAGGPHSFPPAPSATHGAPGAGAANELSTTGLHASVADALGLDAGETGEAESAGEGAPLLLGALPVGARLILRCRKDWRAAAVAAFEPDRARVVLSVASPTGHTYRVRRPADSLLTPDGPLPVLGGGVWRACFARYDLRW